MPETNPTNHDRFWRTVAIVLIVVMGANTLLGYLRKQSQSPNAPSLEVSQIPALPNPKLDRILSAVDFDSVKLEVALTNLIHRADLNVVILWTPIKNAGIVKDTLITVHLKNVSVATALDSVLSLADPNREVEWNENGGVVTVGTQSSLDKSQLVVRVYDVKHLLAVLYHPSAGSEAVQQNNTQNVFQSQSQQQPAESPDEFQVNKIKGLIIDNVQTNTWKDNGGDVGSITSFGDLLFITQSEQAQRKIEAFLQLIDRK